MDSTKSRPFIPRAAQGWGLCTIWVTNGEHIIHYYLGVELEEILRLTSLVVLAVDIRKVTICPCDEVWANKVTESIRRVVIHLMLNIAISRLFLKVELSVLPLFLHMQFQHLSNQVRARGRDE